MMTQRILTAGNILACAAGFAAVATDQSKHFYGADILNALLMSIFVIFITWLVIIPFVLGLSWIRGDNSRIDRNFHIATNFIFLVAGALVVYRLISGKSHGSMEIFFISFSLLALWNILNVLDWKID